MEHGSDNFSVETLVGPLTWPPIALSLFDLDKKQGAARLAPEGRGVLVGDKPQTGGPSSNSLDGDPIDKVGVVVDPAHCSTANPGG